LAVADRVRSGLTGRRRQVLAIAALASVASVGLVAANIDNGPTPSLTTVAASATAERQNATVRADRATRDAVTAPTTSATPKKKKSVTPAPKAKATKSTKAAPVKAAPKPAPVKAAAWGLPLPGAEVTSCFGQRWGVLHAGIDFAKPENTPIQSIGSGTVVSAGWAYSGYGDSVVVDHHNGFLTHYAHMNRHAVKVGQNVKTGQVLGYEGSTGDSTGPHLHFEVHAGMWNQVNPAPWLRAHGVRVGC
jgi:murein DD-endopeptidase MepM/ murein hydrolase activator NlpD